MIPGFDKLNYYEVLDITPGKDAKEIQEGYYRVRSAFARNALASYSLYTPEEREKILRLIEEAYHTLIDEKAREEYEQKLAEERARLIKEGKLPPPVLPLLAEEREEKEETLEKTGTKTKMAAEKEAPLSSPPRKEKPETAPPEPPPVMTQEQVQEKRPEPEKGEDELKISAPEPTLENQAKPAAPEASKVETPKVATETKPTVAPGPETPAPSPPPEMPERPSVPPSVRPPVAPVIPSASRGRPPVSPIKITPASPSRPGADSETKRLTNLITRPGAASPSALPTKTSPPLTKSRPSPELPTKGKEEFEDTVFNIPPPRKPPTTPLDYLETNFSGQFLKATREAKGISLDQVWETTRIRKPILVAIEEEDYKKLPADVFLKGMLLIYARFLELPHPETVVKGYMERVIAAREWLE